jgi:cytosine/uracil/thiamine/allantoin permease
VNLVDYFLVRKGHYAIAEIFRPDGIYGRWGWRGILSYLVGFGAMIPFFSTGLFSGWVANAAHGADFSLFVGLPVSGLLYWVLSRNIDVAAEQALAEREADALEREAVAHLRTDAE